MEALCRMTTEKRRQELAYEWFSMDFIANAFKEIKDCEFETVSRMYKNNKFSKNFYIIFIFKTFFVFEN